jgi:ubiquinone/menaquinone biosynthesis C-methylase UbiE
LCSVEHPELALREIFRVLKTGGKFSFVEHGKSPVVSVSVIQNVLTPLSKSLAGGCHLNRDMEALVGDASFKIQEIKKFYQKSKPLGFMYKGVATVSN